jgi:predicted exporter
MAMTDQGRRRRRLPRGTGVWVASILVLGAAAATVATKVDVRTGIDDFVQGGAESVRLRVLGDLLAAKRTRTMAFAIGAADEAVHRQAAGELRRRLVASGLFAWVRGGAEAGDAEAFHQLYFARRWGLVDVPTGPLGPWVDARIARSKEALASPMGPLIARIVSEDPILAFPDLLRRLQESSRPLEERGGQLQTADGRWSVVFAQAKAKALQGNLQTPVVETIERALGELGASGGKVTVLWTGVNRFAVETERRIRRELAWIGILSTIPVFALYILVFRSLRQIFAGLIIIGIALAAAVLICQGLFGSVHGLALTFGASLIGVTVDYAAHYSVHLVAAPAEERARVLKMLLRATATGVVTTVAAFAAIAGGRLPAVQQIAVLGVAGALIAFTLTHLLLPRFIPPRPARPAAAPEAVPGRRVIDTWLLGLDRHARAVSVVTGLVLLGASAGLLRWQWQDDVAAFKTPLPALEDETARLQRILGRDGQGPSVVVTGADDEQALRTHEAVVARLDALRSGGAVGAVASVQPALLSRATQRERLSRLQTADVEGPYRAALEREGFRAGSFPAWKDLFKDAAPPLTPHDIAASPLAFLVDAWRLGDEPGARPGYVIQLQNVGDETRISAEVERFPGVFSIRPAALLEDTYRQFRDRIVVWLAVGVALVVGIMIVVYRRPSFVLAGVLPALFGSAATLGLLAWLGIPGNVLHVVSLVLVLGLGVDYGVYLVEAREGSIGLSIRGILLGAATTAVSFGALAFSSNTAIHTLGLTSAIGIAFTTATCPLVIFIVRGRGPSGRSSAT